VVKTAETLAARILFYGGVGAIVLMLLGITGFLWIHGVPSAPAARGAPSPDAHVIYTSVADVGRALARWPAEPLAVVAVGILMLLATPVVSVVAVFSVFAGAGDRRYTVITAMLIVALLVSLLVVSGR
jgi:uncharacterized membrane protein